MLFVFLSVSLMLGTVSSANVVWANDVPELLPEEIEISLEQYDDLELVEPAEPQGDVNMETSVDIDILQGNSSVTITFDSNGGSPALQTSTRVPGERIETLPSHGSRGHATFVGWYDTPGPTGGTRFTTDTLVPSVDTILWARWQVTLSFSSARNDSFPLASHITRTLGMPQIGALPPGPTSRGDVVSFIGWFAPDGTGPIDYNTPIPEVPTVFVARWVYNRTLTFRGNGGSPASQQVIRPEGSQLETLPESPAKPGYAFVGWFDTPDATGGTQITAEYIVPNANTTF